MSYANLFFGLTIVVFFIFAIVTTIYISNKIGSSDNRGDIASAIRTITIANVVLIFLLAVISYIYINNSPGPGARSTYYMVIIHLSLLFSLSSLGVASIEKFSA
jgi:hypothetical protein